MFDEIKESAVLEPGRAEPHEIDELNILHATMLAMQRAVAGLSIVPEFVLIDGNRCPSLPMPLQAVVKGRQPGGRNQRSVYSGKKSLVTPKWPRWTSYFPTTDLPSTKAIPPLFTCRSCRNTAQQSITGAVLAR